MRKQQQVWQKEHQHETAIPSMAYRNPSSSVIYFFEFLRRHKVHLKGSVVDIGCGKGSNTVFFAQQGYKVCAIDYVQEALDATNAYAKEAKVDALVETFLANIDSTWFFPDDFFDIALDCFSSIDIETQGGREIYRQELFRTLRPGGYALVTVVSTKDEIEKDLLVQSPGEEPNSTIWPNGKFQKDYTEEELLKFYKDFAVCDLQKVHKRKLKLGKEYTAENFWIILQKK